MHLAQNSSTEINILPFDSKHEVPPFKHLASLEYNKMVHLKCAENTSGTKQFRLNKHSIFVIKHEVPPFKHLASLEYKIVQQRV